jgi:phosphotransferase system  glucose/maltose/N-acetylglucosamine-specific IIC component
VFEFRAYRYADGLSFKEALHRLLPYTADKKFGNAAFEGAVVTLMMYWMWNVIITFFKNPPADSYHAVATLLASITTPIVLAVVLAWALDVFTRRLFGEALGKFLFATFVVGALFHPFLGVATSFLFSWAMFGKARDAAAATAIVALSLFAVLLPGLMWTLVLLL